jgi:hypothetical protein
VGVKNAMNKQRRARGFIVVFLFFFFSAFPGAEAWANGNVSADLPISPGKAPISADVNRSVRKAPVKRPPRPVRKNPVAAGKTVQKKPQPPKPKPLTPLERGISLMERNRYEEARPWLQRAVQEERRNPYSWYWYGMAHEKVGQYQQAQFFYARALEIDPAFPPFSRVVTYPNEGDRVPLWDPRRPARVYSVETESRGVTVVPPGSSQATKYPSLPPIDPERPKAPVYVPPEPNQPFFPGDAAQPPVYVPPPPPGTPVYMPPNPDGAAWAPVYAPPAPGGQ